MIPFVLAAVGGAWFASRRGPTAKTKKLTTLGPLSGLTYQVDDLTNQGIIVVHCQGSSAVFKREKPKGFSFVDGRGNPEVIACMIRDFLPPRKSGGENERVGA